MTVRLEKIELPNTGSTEAGYAYFTIEVGNHRIEIPWPLAFDYEDLVLAELETEILREFSGALHLWANKIDPDFSK